VVQNLARNIPVVYHPILFLVGSLAVAHHFRKQLATFTINTKDADLVVTVSLGDLVRCRDLAQELYSRGWTRRLDPDRPPQPSPTPHKALPAIRLNPPKALGFFIEFLGLPESDPVESQTWIPIQLMTTRPQDTGWYGLPIFRFMGLTASRLLQTDTSIRCAHPSNMAHSLLLSHTTVGTERMSALVKEKRILRSAKDLGRAITIARLSGREEVETWPTAWAEAIQKCFPKTYKDVGATIGMGLRALLADPVALEEARFSATYQGFLAQDAVTIDGFRGDAERLLVDAIEPFEASLKVDRP
jgi:hypothetical protein